eukprot:TRINITY_DN2692_c0_g1_i6.p1 TRINITY_DN2692_c0_g1~~TRINITY_DN2692_c0_g1_i6.p1  ORF type:complete len:104 (-),score=7.26 TRINITY_DN2692_c0_g1_i6:417-728(-)
MVFISHSVILIYSSSSVHPSVDYVFLKMTVMMKNIFFEQNILSPPPLEFSTSTAVLFDWLSFSEPQRRSTKVFNLYRSFQRCSCATKIFDWFCEAGECGITAH